MKRTAIKNTLFILSVVTLSLLLACCVLAILLLPIKIVYAESTQEVVYAPVSDLENNEYAGVSTIKLIYGTQYFYIPESYYVSDITIGPMNFCSVKYCGFNAFYIETTDSEPNTTTVTFADDVSPSPDVLLTLKEGIQITLGEENITNEYTIKLLGYGVDDETQIFIVAIKDGTPYFGFASRDSFENFVVPYHPIAQAEREDLLASKFVPDPDNGDIIPNTSLSLRIILIIGICVPAVIIAFLLFKPSKVERTQGKNTLHKNRSRNEFDYDSPRSYSSDKQNGYDDGYDRGYSRGYNDARNNSDTRYD